MRFIPTKIHGVIDYIVGAALILVPWIFGFAAGGAETWVPVIIGVGLIGYSLFTDYEVGVVRKIPMRIHLGIEVLAGVILAVSPWLFGFNELVWAPHLIVGLLAVGAGVLTQVQPSEVGATGRRSTATPTTA